MSRRLPLAVLFCKFVRSVETDLPKIKTHKGAAKRFSFTGTGKLRRTKGLKSHLRRRRAKRWKRLYDKMLPTDKSDEKRIRRLIPYQK